MSVLLLAHAMESATQSFLLILLIVSKEILYLINKLTKLTSFEIIVPVISVSLST